MAKQVHLVSNLNYVACRSTKSEGNLKHLFSIELLIA